MSDLFGVSLAVFAAVFADGSMIVLGPRRRGFVNVIVLGPKERVSVNVILPGQKGGVLLTSLCLANKEGFC